MLLSGLLGGVVPPKEVKVREDLLDFIRRKEEKKTKKERTGESSSPSNSQ